MKPVVEYTNINVLFIMEILKIPVFIVLILKIRFESRLVVLSICLHVLHEFFICFVSSMIVNNY